MKKNLDSILSGWIPSVLIIISQWRCMVNRTNLYQIIEKSILQHPSISTPTASLSMADQFPPHGVCLQTNCPVVVVRKLIPRSGCSTILTFCRKQTTSTARESHLPSSPMYWLMISWTHHTLSCFATNEFIQLTWCACWMNPPLDESKTKLALFRGGCCGHTQTPRWDWYWCRRGRRRHRRSIDRPSPYNIIMCGQFTRRVGLYWTSPRSSTDFFFRSLCLIVLEIFIVGSSLWAGRALTRWGRFAFGGSLQDGIFANQSGFSGVSVEILVKRVKFTE